jgi:threonine aldolase
MIDLRSDTVTKPTPKMLVAMTSAEVGDDVFDEDPTVHALEQKISGMFGKEAGLFVPSGVMSNQLGIKVLTQPGDELIIEEKGHVFNYETSATPFLSGVQIHPVKGNKGKLSVSDLLYKKRGAFNWEPNTTLLCIENSTNKGGGACYTKQELLEIKQFAEEEQLLVHLDGARIWNAITATGIEASFFGSIAETISVCFSKGLGAPIGSMLLGSKQSIQKARRFRKMWGGGMRQVGILAAAADFAVNEHWPLLEIDHKQAKKVAETIASCSGLSIDLDSVETNILLFDVNEGSAGQALELLEKSGIRMVQFGPQTIRATFHFQIDEDAVNRVCSRLKELFG